LLKVGSVLANVYIWTVLLTHKYIINMVDKVGYITVHY